MGETFSHSCGATWTGEAKAHCATCHRTFGGVSGFDQHRADGACVPPDARGLVEIDGIWRWPVRGAGPSVRGSR